MEIKLFNMKFSLAPCIVDGKARHRGDSEELVLKEKAAAERNVNH
jgi:hypothetical protein